MCKLRLGSHFWFWSGFIFGRWWDFLSFYFFLGGGVCPVSAAWKHLVKGGFVVEVVHVFLTCCSLGDATCNRRKGAPLQVSGVVRVKHAMHLFCNYMYVCQDLCLNLIFMIIICSLVVAALAQDTVIM